MVGVTSHGAILPVGRPGISKNAAIKGLPAGLSDRRCQSRARLLGAARKLFTEKGYADTRPQDICREAGVGQGSFYLYFKDKLDCFLAFTEEADQELNDFIRIYSTGSMPFAARVHAIFYGVYDYAQANPGVLRAVIADTSVLSMYGAVPFKIGTQELLAVIEEGKDRGEIDPDLNSKYLVYLMWGAISVGCVQAQQGLFAKQEIIQNITTFIVAGTRANQAIPNNNLRASKLPVPRRLREAVAASLQYPSPRLSGKRLSNRNKLCAAARCLFATKGYDVSGPKEISKKAGVAIGTFYSYFEDKLDCFLTVTYEAAYEMLNYIVVDMSSSSSCEEMLRRLIRAALEYSAKNPGVFRTILVDIDLLSKRADGIELPTYTSYCNLIAGFGDAGYISRNYNMTLVALLIAAIIKQSDTYIEDLPSKREQVIENTCRFVLNAVCVEA